MAAVYNDPEISFRVQNWAREQYGYDSDPFFGYASYGGMEFGGKIKLPETDYEQAPSHVSFAVENESDVERLVRPDVRSAGMLPAAMQFSQIQVKQGLYPSVVVGGPFTIAGNISPVERLCRWLLKKPELGHRLLRLATDHIIDVVRYWTDTFGQGRVGLQIWEPLASNQIISPRQFEKFVLPYQIELHQKVLDLGVRYILCHICGEQNLNLPLWSQVPMGNPGIVSIGREVDITTAIKYFGDSCIIAGNIEPSVIQTGKPQEIYALCRQAIEKGKQAPRGYILMQGCEVPVGTPPYNLFTMRKAIDDLGGYD